MLVSKHVRPLFSLCTVWSSIYYSKSSRPNLIICLSLSFGRVKSIKVCTTCDLCFIKVLRQGHLTHEGNLFVSHHPPPLCMWFSWLVSWPSFPNYEPKLFGHCPLTRYMILLLCLHAIARCPLHWCLMEHGGRRST